MRHNFIDAAIRSLGSSTDGVYRGRKIQIHTRVGSTMDVVDELIRTTRPDIDIDGTYVIALEQSKGRGAKGKTWQSRRGNAMFSRTVELRAGEFGQMVELASTKASATIVQRYISGRNSFKYPNDVLVDGAKIIGSLVEPFYDLNPHERRTINLGVGANLRVAPPLKDGRATTSFLAYGATLTIGKFIEEFDEELRNVLAQFRAEGDFTPTLQRMGLADKNGQLTLQKEGYSIGGRYAGFRVLYIDNEPVVHLLLKNDRGDVEQHQVRSFKITSEPSRSSLQKVTTIPAPLIHAFG